MQVPPAASPWKMRSPKATCSDVAPGGTGSDANVVRPASGCVPSGGPGSPEVVAVTFGDGAAVT